MQLIPFTGLRSPQAEKAGPVDRGASAGAAGLPSAADVGKDHLFRCPLSARKLVFLLHLPHIMGSHGQGGKARGFLSAAVHPHGRDRDLRFRYGWLLEEPLGGLVGQHAGATEAGACSPRRPAEPLQGQELQLLQVHQRVSGQRAWWQLLRLLAGRTGEAEL